MSESDSPHKGYYTRGYLPHLDEAERQQFVTFRLADSLPASVIEGWKQELRHTPKDRAEVELRRRGEKYLDSGMGSCILHDPDFAGSIIDALRRGDDSSYRLLAFTIMPNHAHVLMQQVKGHSLPVVVRNWKGRSAREINLLRSRSEPVWQLDYFDRYIRDEKHFTDVVAYILMNPVKAGLVPEPEDWPFSWVRPELMG